MIPLFILIVSIIFLLLGVGLSSYFGYFSMDWFLSSLIIISSYGVGFLLLLRFMREPVITERDGDIHVDFKKMNIQLSSMSGGRPLQWDSGLSRRSIVKEYKNIKGEPELFRSFLGYTESNRQLILVIYNITRQSVWRFWSHPGKYQVTDPFHKDYFQPFEKTGVLDAGLLRRKNKSRRPGVYYDDTSYAPSDEAADRMIRELDED
jgi:hypothetical protein